MRVYADTSVFGGAFDEEISSASRAFLGQVQSGRFLLILSPVLEEEVLGAPEEVHALYETLAGDAEAQPLAEEAVRLQQSYLDAGIVGPRWATDALHVAHATICECQMIVSWNFRHIVHYEKMALYNAINVREGYRAIGIHTPSEVIEYEDEDA